MGNVPSGWDGRRQARPTSLRSELTPTPPPPAEQNLDGDGQQRIIDLRDVPALWPTKEGMVAPAPHAWRYQHEPDRLAAVDAFYRDILWNVQLELDGVDWPGRTRGRVELSAMAALRDVARLWQLPSAEDPLPLTDTARQARNARRHQAKVPRLPGGSRGDQGTDGV